MQAREYYLLREIGEPMMSQEYQSVQKMKNDAEMMERLLHRLKDLWQYPHELTFEMVENLITELPEEDKARAIQALAEHLINVMKFRFLEIMAKFHQMAREEIDAEERDEIASDARQELLPMLERLGKHISIHSVKELVLLANITLGLYNLCHVESVDQAERWLYRLPTLYRDRLVSEHLIKEPAQISATVVVGSLKKMVWSMMISDASNRMVGYLSPEAVHIQTKIGQISSSLVA